MYHDIFGAAELFASLGIAAHTQPAPCRALWGAAAWGFSRDELKKFLRQPLWLDGTAARILCSRGLSAELGFEMDKPLAREASGYSIERWHGRRGEERASVNLLPRFHPLHLPPHFRVWSEVANYHLRPMGACLASGRAASGGRLLLSAFDLALPCGSVNGHFPMIDARRRLYQEACADWSGGLHSPLSVIQGAQIFPLDFCAPDRWVIGWNLLTDAQIPVLNVPDATRVKEAWRLQPLQTPQKIGWTCRPSGGGIEIRPKGTLHYLGLFAARVQ